jgi:predicted PurR-regulated permease PerM
MPHSRREISLKRILVAFLLLAALMIPVGSAGAATQAKQIKTLQKQMKTMQTQVKTLKKQVKTLQSQVFIVNAIANVNWSATACSTAMTADLFQSTWAAVPGTTAFNSFLTPQLADYGACSDLKLTRGTNLASDWTAFGSMINFLYGP